MIMSYKKILLLFFVLIGINILIYFKLIPNIQILVNKHSAIADYLSILLIFSSTISFVFSLILIFFKKSKMVIYC